MDQDQQQRWGGGRWDSLKAGVAPEDVVPGLFDEHPIQRQNVEPNLDQNVLERSRAADQNRK